MLCVQWDLQVTRMSFFVLFLKGMNQRNGTDEDANNLRHVFLGLRYNVKVYNDLSALQMREILTAGEFDSELFIHSLRLSSILSCPQIYLKKVFLVCSVKGWSQRLVIIRLHYAQSWRRRYHFWYRRPSRSQVPHITFPGGSMHFTGWKAKAFLHPGIVVIFFPSANYWPCLMSELQPSPILFLCTW